MDDKQFHTVLGLLLTFVILSGTYFIGNYIFLQSQQTNSQQTSQQANPQDHKTVNQINATVNEILAILKDQGGSPLIPVPAPLPPVINNQTNICDNSTVPIENITNKLPANQC